jgi:phosphinothricin acetyltransferase
LTVEFVIREMRADDADRVLAIYQDGLDGGQASFETTAPTWPAFDAGRLDGHRFVAVLCRDPLQTDCDEQGHPTDTDVIGWVAVSPVSTRDVYAGVVEHSVYVAPAARGHGVGGALLDALIASTEAAGIWTIQSAIFPENTASLALHAAAGFRVVGIRERIGRHHGHWRDTVLVERRSPAL